MFDTEKLAQEIQVLMLDDEVNNKKGNYPYVLIRDEKCLNLRAFTPSQKRVAYEKQKGNCPRCESGKHYKLEEMEADHITPWHLDGKTNAENCQMLCMRHNREKSGK